jgi:hypothetical protein
MPEIGDTRGRRLERWVERCDKDVSFLAVKVDRSIRDRERERDAFESRIAKLEAALKQLTKGRV